MNAAQPTKQKLAGRYLRAADIGTVGLLIVLVIGGLYLEGLEGRDVPLWIIIPLVISLLGMMWSFAYMFFRRKIDEFTLAMWHSGVTVAFFTIIAWSLFGLPVQAFIKGFMMAHTGDPNTNVISDWTTEVALTAYFIGFHFKRFRGDF